VARKSPPENDSALEKKESLPNDSESEIGKLDSEEISIAVDVRGHVPQNSLS
jgi:hypothetical protein